MFETLGGFFMLYILACTIPPAIARAVDAASPNGLFAWMLLTGWTPFGWLAAALFIWMTRSRSVR